ncbi:hypothetical protein ATC03_06705 [Agromyces aureus]|uniref:Uncharacterized protein n=1 Tax=Agromyces aureus TaxID=453304 RepID=A0A191WE63_9MICO|nr:hypothetical protein ATC03_06705 [Agromyces aureus]
MATRPDRVVLGGVERSAGSEDDALGRAALQPLNAMATTRATAGVLKRMTLRRRLQKRALRI